MRDGGILDLSDTQNERDIYSTEPVDGDEGYDPHEEHREYERLKEQYRRAKEEIETLRRKNGEAKPKAAVPEEQKTDWRRAFVLAEILSEPRCKKTR